MPYASLSAAYDNVGISDDTAPQQPGYVTRQVGLGHESQLDVEHHRVVEDRTVRPAEASGAIYLRDLALSPDGRTVAYIYGRNVGYLYLLRGLLAAGR